MSKNSEPVWVYYADAIIGSDEEGEAIYLLTGMKVHGATVFYKDWLKFPSIYPEIAGTLALWLYLQGLKPAPRE